LFGGVYLGFTKRLYIAISRNEIVTMKDNKTLDFYKNNAKELITKYDNAQVKSLDKLFEKYIYKYAKVLDIGFGSGRDLRMIQAISPNVFGLDACEEFADHANNTTLKAYFQIAIDKIKSSANKFDVVISIAVLMYLIYIGHW
jgi:2-polyprenyl-3-methyl-5-hydroxy-6-metoxy-1,4-benzoquinol methylase